MPALVLLLALLRRCGAATPPLEARIVGFEAEHQSLLDPSAGGPTPLLSGGHWAAPVLDDAAHLFSWRVQAVAGDSATGAAARNVTQIGAVLTLAPVTGDVPPIVCRAGMGRPRLLCGGTYSTTLRPPTY